MVSRKVVWIADYSTVIVLKPHLHPLAWCAVLICFPSRPVRCLHLLPLLPSLRKRLKDICNNSGEEGTRLFAGDINPNDICQGQLGDCWLMSALACLAQVEGAIQQCFLVREVCEACGLGVSPGCRAFPEGYGALLPHPWGGVCGKAGWVALPMSHSRMTVP